MIGWSLDDRGLILTADFWLLNNFCCWVRFEFFSIFNASIIDVSILVMIYNLGILVCICCQHVFHLNGIELWMIVLFCEKRQTRCAQSMWIQSIWTLGLGWCCSDTWNGLFRWYHHEFNEMHLSTSLVTYISSINSVISMIGCYRTKYRWIYRYTGRK